MDILKRKNVINYTMDVTRHLEMIFFSKLSSSNERGQIAFLTAFLSDQEKTLHTQRLSS